METACTAAQLVPDTMGNRCVPLQELRDKTLLEGRGWPSSCFIRTWGRTKPSTTLMLIPPVPTSRQTWCSPRTPPFEKKVDNKVTEHDETALLDTDEFCFPAQRDGHFHPTQRAKSQADRLIASRADQPVQTKCKGP